MQETLSSPKTTPTTQSPGAKAINEAFHEAQEASQDAVFKAIVCGIMLIEQRDSMSFCHRGKNLPWQGTPKEDSDKFTAWLKSNCPEIPQRTAYRWMEVAFKVIAKLMLGPDETRVPLSQRIEHNQDGDRDTLTEYLAGKTMRDCLASAIVDGDDSQRALNGAISGGTCGESRKDYALFVSKHLLKINTNLENWDKLSKEKPAVAQEMADAMRRAIMGGMLRVDRTGRTENVNGWPEQFCRLMNDLTNERLRK